MGLLFRSAILLFEFKHHLFVCLFVSSNDVSQIDCDLLAIASCDCQCLLWCFDRFHDTCF